MLGDGLQALAALPPGQALAAVLEGVDAAALTEEQAVPVLRAWSRQRAHDHARMAATLARVAALSRQAGGPVWGEWAGAEIAAALTWTERRAAHELEFAEALAGLPLVAAAFDEGRIDQGKAAVFTDVLGPAELTAQQTETLCATYLLVAPGLTSGQLRHRLTRALLAVDPEAAARRYRRAVAGRGVVGYLSADGTAVISASGLPAEQAAVACARVDELAARLRRGGYPGSIGQIRADVFLRLLDGSLTGLTTAEIIATLLGAAGSAAPAEDPSGPAGSPVGSPASSPAAGAPADPAGGRPDAGPTAPSGGASPAAADGAPGAGSARSQGAAAPADRAEGWGDVGSGGPSGSGFPAGEAPADPADGRRDADAGFAMPSDGGSPAATDGAPEASSARQQGAAPTADQPDGRPEVNPAAASGGESPAAVVSGGESAAAVVSGGESAAAAVSGGESPAAAVSGGESAAAADPAASPRTARARPAGVEIRVGLATLLGLDRRPGEIPGWGPVVAEVARELAARSRHAPWRFAVVDEEGYLLLAGTIRHRPTPPDPALPDPALPDPALPDPALPDSALPRVLGGLVELHVTAELLAALAHHPGGQPAWAAVIGDIAGQFADRRRLLAALGAHPDSRHARGPLLRHIQVRDRTCVAPGCRRPARACDADHTRAYAEGGPTTAANTGPLCPRHHALKHHAGWRLQQPRPGHFRWTSPLHECYSTRGEPIMPPLPEPRPGPQPPEPSRDHPRDIDMPTYQPRPRPQPPADPPPRRRSWTQYPAEDPDDPAPF